MSKPIRSPPPYTPRSGPLNHQHLLDFLVEHSKTAHKPLTLIHLFSEYRQFERVPRSPKFIHACFRREIAPTIHESVRYDDETKARVLFATSTSVQADFLEKLRASATVEVDQHQRITKFFSSTLQLEGTHSRGTQRANQDHIEQIIVKSEPIDSYFEEETSPTSPTSSPLSVEHPEEPSRVVESPSLPSLGGDQLGLGGDGAAMGLMSSVVNIVSKVMNMQKEFLKTRESSPPPSPQASSSTTIKQFLNHIQLLILSIDSPELAELHHRITHQLQKLQNEPISMSKVQLALQSIITISMAHGFGEGGGARLQTTNAKNVLKLIEMYISAEESTMLEDMHKQLKATISTTPDDKEVPIANIRMAIESALITIGIPDSIGTSSANYH